jgi:SAM-dependent methyltransferase
VYILYLDFWPVHTMTQEQNMSTTTQELDPKVLSEFKDAQKKGWAHFAPLALITTATAAHLVKFAGVRSGQRVLDVGCGTGVVAITAARLGAHVTGLDLTPELLEQARENSRIAELHVDWHEGDAEDLPFEDASFDVVLSQFGHMFAPRPEVAVAEMLRVLKPSGTLAFSTWPPELLVGSTFTLVGRYLPPPPPGISPPHLWGDPNVVRERLGSAVRGLTFDRARMRIPALSVKHYRLHLEQTAGPVIRLVAALKEKDPDKLATFRKEYEALASEYLEDNIVHQDYLLSRAVKA